MKELPFLTNQLPSPNRENKLSPKSNRILMILSKAPRKNLPNNKSQRKRLPLSQKNKNNPEIKNQFLTKRKANRLVNKVNQSKQKNNP
jgi:hypothetical protein